MKNLLKIISAFWLSCLLLSMGIPDRPLPKHRTFSTYADLRFFIPGFHFAPTPPVYIEKDSTVTVASNVTWKIHFAVPEEYYSKNGADSARHMFIFFPGAGEAGAGYGDGALTKYGPIDYMHAGWDGGVVLGNGTHYPIYVHVEQIGDFPFNVKDRISTAIDQLAIRFRVKVKPGTNRKSITTTGLSAGGATCKYQVMSDPASTTGPWPFASKVLTVIDVEGVKPDDLSPYPTLLANFARAGGKMVLIEGGNDGRGQDVQANTMNAAVAGSAIRILTTSADPMFGHGNWNWVYGGDGDGTSRTPKVFTALNGTIYQYAMRQGDTSLSSGSGNPIAQAGTDKVIYYTVGQVSLDGTGSVDGNGEALIYAWTRISGPNTPTITTPTASTTTVTGLIQGIYVYRLTVTDASSNTSTDDITITVQAPPVVNAGADQTISISTATLAATATDEGTVSSSIVTKLKAPGQALRRIGFVGSSTGFGYGVAVDSTAAYVVRTFYKSIGVIDTLINFSVISTTLWNGLATGTPINAGRPAADPAHNLNAAKAAGCTDIIWMYTTNGLDDPTVTWAEYYDIIKKARDSTVAKGMTFHLLTPKTRDGFSPSEEQKLKDFSDSTKKFMPTEVIDVWYGFTVGTTTATKPEFDKGDLVHWNGLGQLQCGKTIIAKNIFRNTVSSAAVITTPTSLTTTITGLTSGAPHTFQVSSRDNDSLWNYDIIEITTTVAAPTTNNCRVGSPQVTTLSQTATREIYDPFGGQTASVKGADTLRIPAGDYDIISLGGLVGAAGCPIVITNYGGRVYVKQFRIGEKVISPAKYFKVVGTVSGGTYGIFIGDSTAPVTNSNGLTMSYVSNVEVANIEVTGTLIGIYCKPIPDTTNANANYPLVATNDSLYIHNTYIHNIGGEGMYIGDTYPNADPYVGNVIPGRLDHVQIANNIVDGTDWDGIQLSNARTGAKIHDNTVLNFGRINMGAQQAGIILGGNTNGKVYNNVVRFGTGNGIECFGYGLNEIYSNEVEATGYDGTANGQQSFFGHDFLSTVETNAKQIDSVYSNTIIHPKLDLEYCA
jgi:hypothetical protein